MKANKTYVTVDPPSGWKYGFPKAIMTEDYLKIKDLGQWCVDNGYPKMEKDSYGDYFHIGVTGPIQCEESTSIRQEVSNLQPAFNREAALQWWNSIEPDWKVDYCIYHNDKLNLKGRTPSSLTGREIEEIYKSEHKLE